MIFHRVLIPIICDEHINKRIRIVDSKFLFSNKFIWGLKLKSWYVNHNSTWIGRGWHYYLGSGAGVFSFADANGHASSYISFRVVLITMIGVHEKVKKV